MQIVGWWFGRQGQGIWAEAGNISFSDVDVDSGQAGFCFPYHGESFQYETCQRLPENDPLNPTWNHHL